MAGPKSLKKIAHGPISVNPSNSLGKNRGHGHLHYFIQFSFRWQWDRVGHNDFCDGLVA